MAHRGAKTNGESQDRRTPSRYLCFNRAEWARLRGATPLTLTEGDLATLRGINEQLSLDEVAQVYLALSRLLNLYVAATQDLHATTSGFLGELAKKVPYVIGIAGSVAVGKSTTARVLQALLARWPNHPHVDLVTTDGFLFPNRVLEERGLMKRKGFPESYDTNRLIAFLADVKGGKHHASAPVYSHEAYDVLPDAAVEVKQPEVLILEGLNVLQASVRTGRLPRVFVSDYFDFSIYVDAREEDVREWYVQRFLKLRETVFRRQSSYFRGYGDLPEDEAKRVARGIWDEINGPNLRENILPTRERAHLILEKSADHSVQRVRLRKL